MLQGIRDRAQSWVMWVLVILIIIPFAFWGITSYFGPEVNIVVAKVNDRELTLREFQEAYQRQRQRIQSLLGSSFDINQLDEDRLKRETLDRMIDDELVFQAAIANGLRIGDEQLANNIRSLDVFQVNGQFSEAQYDNQLRQLGYQPGGFEYSFRRSLLSAQLNVGIAGSAVLTSADLEQAVRLQDQKRSFAYLLVPASRFQDAAEVTEQAVIDYYDQNLDEFVNPERVKLDYVELSRSGIAEGVSISDAEVEARYETQKVNYMTAEQRRASHLLISLPEGASAEQEEEARKKAQELKARIDAGESFAELAKANSEDPGSAEKNGDLGFFGKGMMDKPFEDAVFAMSEGEVSEPVKSSFGFHIIMLTGVQPAETKPLAAVRDQLRRELQLEKADHLFFEQAEKLANMAFENPDTLAVAADELGLKVNTSDWFTRAGGSGVASDPRVVNIAFSEDVLVQGNNSELLELPGGRVITLRVEEHEPSSQRPLEEVHEEITSRLRNARMQELATEHGEELLARFQSGADGESLAAEESLEWSSRDAVGRSDSSVDRAILNRAFQLGHPSPDQPVFGGVGLASRDYAVISLTAVQDGDVDGAESVRSALRTRLERAQGDALFEAFVQALRDDADIRLYTDRL